jgi:glutamate racemase
MSRTLPIGVFDSGIGGLTVLAALQKELPNEKFIYLGDTARLPYGTKSGETIQKYTHQVTELLFQKGIKLLVIACNTATAYGLESIQKSHSPLPVIGVIEPGAQSACSISTAKHIAVLATEATIRGGSYQKAIARINPEMIVSTQACGLFIALVEEGFSSGIVAEEAAKFYLSQLFTQHTENLKPDCLLLGCTHFPILEPVFRALLPDIHIVDSAKTTALAVKGYLRQHDLANTDFLGSQTRFMVTDAPEKFARTGALILKQNMSLSDVELVDI